MPKLTPIDVAHATGGQVLYGPEDTMFTGISTDTRSIASGDLFIPLTGERFDGHDFLSDAIARGAGGVVVEKNKLASVPSQSVPTVTVDNTLEALQQLARWHRARFSGPVVAITGSNGKTTTKDLVAAVLSRKWHVLATEGNLNTEIGLSLTLLKREASHEAVAVEMGMRGLGQIDTLVKIAQPTIGIVTNIGPVHLELLGSLEAITQAKGELIRGLSGSGVAVLNADDRRVMELKNQTDAQVITYGLNQGADVYATGLVSRGLDGMSFKLTYRDQSVSVDLPIVGRHNVSNALAAAAAGIGCGLGLADISRGLAQVEPSGMRMQVVRLPSDVVILNDAYNAAPASMQAGLHALVDLPAKRHIAILGDMLELGEITESEHENIGVLAAQLGIDLLVTVGPHSKALARGARREGLPSHRVTSVQDADAARSIIAKNLAPGDVVLIKASRGMQLETIVAALQRKGFTQGGQD